MFSELLNYMNKQTLTKLELFLHAMFWSIPTILIFRFDLIQVNELLIGKYMHLPMLVNTFLNILLVYLNIFFLYPAFIHKKLSLRQYWLIILIVVIFGAIIKAGICHAFCLYNFSRISDEVNFGTLIVIESLILGLLLFLSVLYCFIKEYFKNNLTNRKLAEEKLTMELKYLKAQINPHFLFNTLNNLYATAIKNNDYETATGITKLSQIMRYMLKDINEKEITLDKEIEYLKSYIDLQKMRFSETDDINIRFDVQGNPFDISVPPFLFIAFIENAFKYGINYKKKSFIDIHFEIRKNVFSFTISNSIHQQIEVQKHGVGLKNIRDRLLLLYPDNHKLEITDKNNIFHVLLEVNITKNR